VENGRGRRGNGLPAAAGLVAGVCRCSMQHTPPVFTDFIDFTDSDFTGMSSN
jgi:hypothetical protein